METGSHDAPVETLPDPTTLTPQERVDRLVEAVESDDLLGVVLFLKFLEEGEVNACCTSLPMLSPRCSSCCRLAALWAPLGSLGTRLCLGQSSD